MKYYAYSLIVAAFLVMYFSMLLALKYSMESLIEERFKKNKQMEMLYEQSAVDGI